MHIYPCGMAKTDGRSKPAKLTRADKKLARGAKRERRRETWRNLRQAFTLTRQNDPRFLPYLVMSGVVGAAVGYLIVFFITGSPYFGIPIALMVGLLAAMFVFSRRAQHSMFAQAEGQPGAAGWMLQQQLRGDWRLTQAVAGTTQLDAVHRLVGRPGVVLVGEGAQHRVRGLIAQEKKKVARLSGDTPIYDIIVGTGEGEVRLAKLNRYLVKLPTNLSKEQVTALDKRLSALGGARNQLPQGPLPPGAKMRNLQRTVRRKS
jgi:F0F1-type ATP synthase assembly protein I